MKKKQLEELVLGFELTGRPFFAALKTADGFESIEVALPEGRVKGRARGVVYSGCGERMGHRQPSRHPRGGPGREGR